MASPSSSLSVLLVGGPTAVLDYAGLRLLTDPTFDPPGDQAGGLTKLTGPAVGADDVGAIDAVLLSHDQHSDNLDVSGRAFLARAGRTLTTVTGAERLGGNAVGLEPWASIELERPAGNAVTVTAVPAQHGPEGCEPVTGPVVGFVLTRRRRPDALRQRRQRLRRRRARRSPSAWDRSSSPCCSPEASASRSASTAPT